MRNGKCAGRLRGRLQASRENFQFIGVSKAGSGAKVTRWIESGLRGDCEQGGGFGSGQKTGGRGLRKGLRGICNYEN